MRKIITLASRNDVFSFYVNQEVHGVFDEEMREFRPFKHQRLHRLWLRLSRPFRKVHGVVQAIDRQAGSITVERVSNPWWKFLG